MIRVCVYIHWNVIGIIFFFLFAKNKVHIHDKLTLILSQYRLPEYIYKFIDSLDKSSMLCALCVLFLAFFSFQISRLIFPRNEKSFLYKQTQSSFKLLTKRKYSEWNLQSQFCFNSSHLWLWLIQVNKFTQCNPYFMEIHCN